MTNFVDKTRTNGGYGAVTYFCCFYSGYRQALFVLVELLRQTGAGAPPLEPPQSCLP